MNSRAETRRTFGVWLLLLAGTAALPAQIQWQRFAPATDFEPASPGVVAYEPISGHGYYLGRVWGGTDLSLWMHQDGAWIPVSTATTVPAPSHPVAAAWSTLAMLYVDGGKTWQFDGTDFTDLTIPTTPTQLDAMAYDQARSLMVARRNSPPQTWEFDGIAWQQRAPTTAPTGTCQMAWHATLQRVVQQVTNGQSRVMYSWDGSNWSFEYGFSGSANGFSMARAPGGGVLMSGGYNGALFAGRSEHWDGVLAPTVLDALPNAPPARPFSLSFYDPVVQATVVTGFGENFSTWIWDGSAWSLSGAGEQPTPGHVVYDSWRGELLQVGGTSLLGVAHGDMWTRRNQQWLRDPSGAFPFQPRRWPSVVFDSWRGRVVLFGGGELDPGAGATYSTAIAKGTYEWDGAQWHDVSPPNTTYPFHPQQTYRSAVAFDRQRGRTVVYGGEYVSPGFNQELSDTWEWDGVAWQLMAPATVPPPAPYVSMAYDNVTGLCWLHSGGQLWTWDGIDWTAAGAVTIADPVWSIRLVEDRARDKLVMLTLNGSYELQGGSWMPVGSRRSTGAAAFDLAEGAIIGIDNGATFAFGDPAAATIAPFGAGCSGTSGVPVLHGDRPPRLGTTLPLRIENAASGVSVGLLGGDVATYAGLQLPVDLTAIGMPGCELRTAIDASQVVAGASWSIPLPAGATSLLGAVFRVQALVLDAPANAFGAVMTNGVALRIGS